MNNFKVNTNPFFFALALLLLASCAQIVAPGGGAKDTTAPTVLKYNPDSAQLGFNSKLIEINFDEYIQLKDLNNQLIISPPLNKTPDIDVKNKTLNIEFDKNEVLKSNTTYCISFGNAVTDVNEGNPVENFKYIFSTGTFIDSLKVKGKVQTAFDHRTEKGILVMLYSDSSDSVVYKSQPDYFGKTKADGTFEINNVKSGKYKMVAIKDANANYKYDGESESIAFYDSLVDASVKKDIELELFQEPSKKVFLKKATHPSYGRFDFVFSQGSDSIRINNLSNDLKGVQEYFEFSKNKDSLRYWITNYQKDSIVLQISNGNKIIDTLEFKFINKEEALKAKRNPLKLSVVNSPDGNQSFDLNKNLVLILSNPVKNIAASDKIILKEDTTLIPNKQFDLISAQSERAIIQLLLKSESTKNYIIKESTNYSLFIPPGTFTDIFNLTNDTIKIDLKTREAKYYGSLKLKLNIPEKNSNYIIQLIDEQGLIQREQNIKKSEELLYEFLHPKKYKLKIIVDENNNGKWDSGNYLQHTQAEKVIYNTELINVRSNWDLELDWKTSP
ncbi:MAG: Ig-like domain-containing protein [Bacteroidetes bacterium]|nr:Ig-like domain-containing protein [Bacteroidota bacterium]